MLVEGVLDVQMLIVFLLGAIAGGLHALFVIGIAVGMAMNMLQHYGTRNVVACLRELDAAKVRLLMQEAILYTQNYMPRAQEHAEEEEEHLAREHAESAHMFIADDDAPEDGTQATDSCNAPSEEKRRNSPVTHPFVDARDA